MLTLSFHAVDTDAVADLPSSPSTSTDSYGSIPAASSSPADSASSTPDHSINLTSQSSRHLIVGSTAVFVCEVSLWCPFMHYFVVLEVYYS